MMKKLMIVISVLLVIIGSIYFLKRNKDEVEKMNEEFNKVVKIRIDGNNYQLILEDNAATRSLFSKLPIKEMFKELNGNEKYFYLDYSLPTKAIHYEKINQGDVMLYGNNCLVIFYESFETTYAYTKIGHIDNLTSLGRSDILVTIMKEDL